MIFLVARNGHLVWGPNSSTTATNWRDRISKADIDREVTHPVANWRHRLEVGDGGCSDLLPFGHFGLQIKAGLVKLIE